MRYVVSQDDVIHQILQKEPLYIPEGMVVLTYEGDAPDNKLYVSDGVVYATLSDETPVVETFPIESYKTETYRFIEDQIDHLRSHYASSVASQNEVYWEKTQEAIDYAAAGFPNSVENYPFIAVDVELNGQTGEEVALNILAKRRQWLSVASKTEKIRKVAKSQIVKCDTKEEVDNVVRDVLLNLNTLS